MKNKKQIILGVLMIFSMISCKRDFLERPPKNLITTEAAYGSLSGIVALTANLYGSMQLEDPNYSFGEAYYLSMFTEEAVPAYTWQSYGPNVRTGAVGWWGYGEVRRVNDFIEKIPTATANLSEKDRNRFLAEARFIRAYHYFAMVKRYGGVPLITKTQEYTGDNTKELQVLRSKEQEVYDFIASELDAIVDDLPPSYTAADGSNRATKWAALALKCRAMLYAASIAKYGSVQLNGLVGIPADQADAYWKKAYDAASIIMHQSGLKLYDVNPDKAANFQELFLKGDADANKEKIFVRSFVYPGQGTSFDYYNQPNNFWIEYSSSTNPTVEMVEEFEYTDGTPGKLKITDASGTPILYDKPEDLFRNKDPRMFGSIITPNTPWAFNGKTSVVELRRGIIDGGVKITRGNISATDVYGTAPNQIAIVGAAGPLTTNGDATKTGFYIKKLLTQDAAAVGGSGKSTIPWMVFRYGEVLLNYAEAAVELGKTADAITAINQLRARAGIAALSTIDVAKVRHERRVELAFENHRFWDLRRWRTGTTEINNKQSYALLPWLMWESGKAPSQMKYTFEIAPTPKNTLTFNSKAYYEPIPVGGMPYLVQNPEY